ncbi:MAG: hypothetical protein GYB64_01885 [Chloroflexi bacterium]|nr:hypothetical protein [Chloroflexota bacterium]
MDPLTHWRIKRTLWPPLAGLGGAALMTGALMLAGIAARPEAFSALMRGGLLAATVLALVGPALTTLTTAVGTADALDDERLLLLRTTRLPEAALIRGLAVQGLLRSRAVIVLATGTAPALILGWAQWLAIRGRADWCGVLSQACMAISGPLDPARIAGLALLALSGPVVVAGLHAAAAAQGVRFAIMWRMGVLAAAAALLTTAVSLLPGLVLLAVVLRAALDMVLFAGGGLLPGITVMLGMLAAAIPLLVARTVLLGAESKGLPKP